jgi:transglutaminase-like putative cysteine protease
MRFEIEHLTRYRYSLPVQLGEHCLRFEPMARAGQRLLHYQLDIDPAPGPRVRIVDPWGNPVERVLFCSETEQLVLRLSLAVETDPAKPQLPWLSPTPDYVSEGAGLAAYLTPLEDSVALQPLLESLLAEAGSDAVTLLKALNHVVHGFYHRGVRLDGPPRSPAQTLALGEGVCRDLTVLFMAAARQLGFASRFVSGYQQGDGLRAQRYLHAWPEVYLSGVGWLGFDPTHDTLVGADHVAVAAAPSAQAVTPVEGGYSFRGELLDSTLETDIRITTR